MNRTDFISYIVIALCTGIFIGFILTSIYVKNVFKDEITVSVSPQGNLHDPYTNEHYTGRIDRQRFKIYFRNGNQTNDEFLGYSYRSEK